MEIKRTWEIEQEHCQMKGQEWSNYDMKQWVSKELLLQWIEIETKKSKNKPASLVLIDLHTRLTFQDNKKQENINNKNRKIKQ